jgi:hypothetical protein
MEGVRIGDVEVGTTREDDFAEKSDCNWRQKEGMDLEGSVGPREHGGPKTELSGVWLRWWRKTLLQRMFRWEKG